MATKTSGRLIAFLLFMKLAVGQIPEVSIQAFKPKGFRASIPDVPDMSLFIFHGVVDKDVTNAGLFVFQGNINKNINKDDVGTISGEVFKPTDGRWVYEDPNLELKVGDIINYYVFASINKQGYVKDNLSYVVTRLEDKSSGVTISPGGVPVVPADCRQTKTKVRGGIACAGQILFEDHFDALNENVWQIEQYIPISHPEHPFVSYQGVGNDYTISTVGGNLQITPKLQQDLPGFSNETIFSGTLNLFNGCTSSAEECLMQVDGADILPPVASARITSKGFAFTYGTVYVRAKLPQGDWLYPEILLEPFLKKYGSSFASGVVKIATARGNRQLYKGANDYSNKVLYGGPVMDFACRDTLLSTKQRKDGAAWGDDFHIYAVEWTPEHIILSVDGEEWARVEPTVSGLRGRFPASCRQLSQSFLGAGSVMAPFDDHFHLTLGVAAGSITEFPDDVTTGGDKFKPWRNSARKAMLTFWQNMDSWLPTWILPRLVVDYVKVAAL